MPNDDSGLLVKDHHQQQHHFSARSRLMVPLLNEFLVLRITWIRFDTIHNGSDRIVKARYSI